MVIFGAPISHGDDAERAVRAALACRTRLQELNADARITLDMHVGVNTGEVVASTADVDQFLATGTAINVGSRLMHSASAGEILVGSITRDLTRASIAYGPARDVQAKNVGTVRAWPVRGVGADAALYRDTASFRAPLIGRDHELDILATALQRVRVSGAAEALLIEGAAGIGKSRLTREFARSFAREQVLVGRCRPYGEDTGLAAVRQMLRADMDIEPRDPWDEAMRKLRARVGVVLADATEADTIGARLAATIGLVEPSDVLPMIGRSEIAGELGRAVCRYMEASGAADGPRLLIFEDMHWGDATLLALVDDLTTVRAPILIICLARSEKDGAGALSVLGRPSRRVTLRALSPAQTRELVAALTSGAVLPPEVLTDLIARAEGNPLYVEEFLRLKETQGTGVTGDEWYRATMAVPASLRALIAARLDGLTADVKALVHRASVFSGAFSTSALEAVARSSISPRTIAEAVARDLFVPSTSVVPGEGPTYRFKHGLIRDVAYTTVPKGERARMHDDLGRWLERTYGDRSNEIVETVAYHAEQAYVLARDLESAAEARLGVRAVELLNAAAMRARHQQDQSAIQLYERAAAVAAHCDVPPVARADALAGAAVCRYWRDGERAPLDAALSAYAGLPPTETRVAALLAQAFAAMGAGRPDIYVPVTQAAIDTARAVGDADVIAEALGVRANGAYQSGDARRYVELVDDALVYARAHGANRQLPRLLMLRHIMAVRQADFALALALEEESERIRALLPLPTVDPAWLARQAGLRHAMRRDREALELVERAIETSRKHVSRIVHGLLLWQLGDAHFGCAHWLEARDAFSEAMGLFAALHQRGQIPEVAARSARARIRLGDLDGAARDIDLALASVLASDVESRSMIAVARGELAAARSEHDVADVAFGDALTALEPSIYIAHLADANVAYARVLKQSGRVSAARERLIAARAFYDDPFAEGCREEIDELLRQVDSASHAADESARVVQHE